MGAEVGIDDVRAEVLPEGKAAVVTELQAHGHAVAVVGDGVNDVAALAVADLGMAVERGTDAAIEAADIVLGRDDLLVVADAVELARRTHATIRPDFGFLEGLGDLPLFDRKGRVRHDGGVVTASPGLYVIGLPFLRRRKSTLIDGAASDAADITAHLAAHLATPA